MTKKLMFSFKKRIKMRNKIDNSILTSVSNYLKLTKKIDPRKTITESSYVVFDTELTGLDIKKDSIVSIGALKMMGSKIDIINYFYRIVEPRSKIKGESVIIHGITPSEASVCPKIDLMLPEFLDFCKNSILVGHFVQIDLSFLNKEMVTIFGFPIQNPAIDTFKIYRWIRKKEENICAFHEEKIEDADLFYLAKKYDIDFKQSHNALNDAFVTAQLFQRFISILKDFNVNFIGDLITIGKI